MRIVIIEDEKVAGRRLKRMVEEALGSTVTSCEFFTTLEDGMEHLEQTDVDLLFLDLNLHDKDGFEILRSLLERKFQTVVVSANTDRAIEAFELGVIDFIPKPFDRERLNMALNRFTGRMNRLGGATALVVKNQGRRIFIPIADIVYVSGAGDYTELHCRDGNSHLYGKSLESLTKVLPEEFNRIHKSYLVDMREIAEVKVFGGGKYTAVLNDGRELPVSRSRYKDLFTEVD